MRYPNRTVEERPRRLDEQIALLHARLRSLEASARQLRAELEAVSRDVASHDASRLASPPPREAASEAITPLDPQRTTPSARHPSPQSPPPLPQPKLQASGTNEFRLGSVWLARIGITAFVMAAAFLAHFVWNELNHPGVRLAVVALLGAGLLGAGRATRNAGETFSKLLSAGGYSVLYLTAYAAHFVEPTRVIANSSAGGAVLLAAGLLLVWRGLSANHPVFASSAVMLSFLATVLTAANNATIPSSIVLAAAAFAIFLIKDWLGPVFVALVGCYSLLLTRTVSDLQLGSVFLEAAVLGIYWVLFLTAGLKKPRLTHLHTDHVRAGLCTLNDAAFFLFAAGLLTKPPYSWEFSAIAALFGTVQTILWLTVRRRETALGPVAESFLAKALLCWLLAMVTYLSEGSLALTLAGFSVFLTIGVHLLRSPVLRAGLVVSVALACGIGVIQNLGEDFRLVGALAPSVAAIGAAWVTWRKWGSTAPDVLIHVLVSVVSVVSLVEHLPAVWEGVYLSGLCVAFAGLSLALRCAPILWLGTTIPALGAMVVLLGSLDAITWHAALQCLLFVVSGWLTFRTTPAGDVLRGAALVLSRAQFVCAILLYFSVVFDLVPLALRFVCLGVPAMFFLLMAGNRFRALCSVVFGVCSLITLLSQIIQKTAPNWPALAMSAALSASYSLSRERQRPQRLRYFLGGLGVLGVLLMTNRLSAELWPDASPAGTWAIAALAFIAAGVGVKERFYRIAGLCLAGVAILQIAVIDIFSMSTPQRILTLFVLGIALLASAYLYNRFRKRLREWT